ncbi:DUF742 domain-containing protein [Streptomyces viridosporus T7A]|uniref:DUF742 domain-containing protein n=1 Tax=Streptomyces viridosporus T7A TaxID=665577 RepID=A0ABX6A8E1_STRVD|nr:DUF742 domain-containing protein [Streptomyces viridosporus]QEU83423.1 DUF742 domain-containing protein [Streptomyces viridosporus T7A]
MTPRGRRRAGMVRPYTPTGGRAAPTRRTLDLATLLIADPDKSLAGLDAHSHRLMQHCLPGVLALAEVSADLQLPAAVTKVLVASLVDSGHLISRNPVPAAQQSDRHLLERILDALHKL